MHTQYKLRQICEMEVAFKSDTYFLTKFFLFFCNVLAFHVDNVDDASDTVTYTTAVDHDISRMENLLDQWTAELKKNVMVLSNAYT